MSAQRITLAAAFGQLFFYVALTRIANWQADILVVISILLAISMLHILSLFSLSRCEESFAIKAIFFWAIIFRLVLVCSPPSEYKDISGDIYRYLWEGQVVAAGENPYLHSPSSAELEDLRIEHLDLWERVHHKEVPALYPPLTQYLFAVLPPSISIYRLVFSVFDLLLLLLLFKFLKLKKLPIFRLAIYAWLPLAILELSHSAHFEALSNLFLVAGVVAYEHRKEGERVILLTTLLALSFLSKFVAAIPLGVIWYRYLRDKELCSLLKSVSIFVAILIALYLPFILQDGFGIFAGATTYGTHWRFNDSLFSLIHYLWGSVSLTLDAMSVAKYTVVLVLFLFWLYFANSQHSLSFVTAVLFFLTLLFAPTVYPWYLLWFAPFLVVLPFSAISASMFVFLSTSLLSYEVLAHPNSWKLPMVLKLIEYLPPLLIFWVLSRNRCTKFAR